MVGFIGAIGLVLDVIGLAFDIADAASKDSAAQATDLTQVYQRLDAIERSIESSRAENQARFNELQNELNRQGMDATIRQFQSIQNNGDEGMRAWLVIHQCRINQARRQSTCPDLAGVQRPVEDSILRARSTLLDIVDVRWRDIDLPTLAGAYNGSGAGRGLAEAAWNFLRTQQNNRVGVAAESPLRSSEKVPVVTPQLSQGMNSILGYYGGLIARYQLLRQLAVLEKDATQNGCEWYEHIAEFFAVHVCQRRLIEQMDDESRRWIYGTNPNGVNSAYARYKMPIVPEGAVAVAGIGKGIWVREPTGSYWIQPTDTLRRILYSDASDQPTKPRTAYTVELMPEYAMRVLIGALEQYSGRARFAREFPNAFQVSCPDCAITLLNYKVVLDGPSGCFVRAWVALSWSVWGIHYCGARGSQGVTPDWVAVDPREAGTDYPMWGW